MYRLKKGQEAFTPVEGPFAGRKFVAGQLYGEIPPGTAGKFEATVAVKAELKAVPGVAMKTVVSKPDSKVVRNIPDSEAVVVKTLPSSEKGGKS